MSLFKKYSVYRKTRTKSSPTVGMVEEDPDGLIRTLSETIKSSKISIACYMKNYMKPNILYLLWQLYYKFDIEFNVFNTIYSQISHSSYFCSILWLKVEHMRILFNTSIEFKVNAEDSLFPMNEELLIKEYEAMNTCYILLTKIISESLEFLVWNKNLRWERRFYLDKIENVYTSNWIELNNWLEALKQLCNNNQVSEIDKRTENIDKKLIERLLEVHEELELLSKDTRAIQKLNEHTAKCVKLNVYLQYAEAQTLASYLFVVEDIEKFHKTYTKVSNNDAQKIIANARQVITESDHKSAILKKNKLDFQMNRVANIGPYGLVKIPFDMNQAFSISIEYKMWRLNRDFCAGIKGFEGIIDGVTGGTTSRVSSTPFTVSDLELMNIPGATEKWVYLPPFEITPEMSIEPMKEYIKGRSPVHMIVVNGGFAFFDNENTLLSIHALEKGSDLFFTFPLFRNMQIRQYRFKDDLLHYEAFPVEPRIKEAGHTGLWAIPEDWTPDEDENDPEADLRWAFVFKDTVQEETQWPHYAFELATIPYSVIEAKNKKYKPSQELKQLKRTIDRVRDFWAVSFPQLNLKGRRNIRGMTHNSSFMSHTLRL